MNKIRENSKSKYFRSLSIFMMSAFFVIILFSWYYKRVVKTVNSSSDSVISFHIKEGSRVDEIASELKKQGVIRSALIFKLYLALNGLGSTLQAGDYEIAKNLRISEVAEELSHGTTDATLTFLEGWRLEEYAEYISSDVRGLQFSGTDFISVAKENEGKLFPDTYRFPKYGHASELKQLLLSNFNSKITEEMKSKFEAKGLDLNQAIVLASIVQREAARKDDMLKVAAILQKRLKEDWYLNADATLQYIVGFTTEDGKGTWWKNRLTNEDKSIDSPFNTYLHKGLPPTPICNPGVNALNAVAEAGETEYYYYLTGNNGKFYYAITQEQHDENIKKYLD